MQKDYQVERVCEHWEWQREPKNLSSFLQFLVEAFRQLQLQKHQAPFKHTLI